MQGDGYGMRTLFFVSVLLIAAAAGVYLSAKPAKCGDKLFEKS